MEDFARLNLVGESPAFLRCLALVRKYAACHATVLVQGETGTGKELAARAIHYLGGRSEYPFIPVNCGAIPETLVENELFGHAPGAFTDARDARCGVIADAEGGTLFLDEVEALSFRGQVALLRFLQDRQYRPLGARRPLTANVRVIAAANENLNAMVERGQFRRDLFFRLRVMSLEMPPLRERGSDIVLLAEQFLRQFSCQYGDSGKKIAPESLILLAGYPWPGNVRELESVIHREFLLAEGPTIRIDPSSVGAEAESARGLPSAFHAASGESFSRTKARFVEEFEKMYLCRILQEAGGNVSLAARRCGKERRTLGKLLKKYGIDRRPYADA